MPWTVARIGALLVGMIAAGLVGLPAAHASDTVTKSLTLLPGQSGSIGRVVSNTDITPVSTCDPELTVTFDATMEGTVHVAPDATLGLYTCTIDFQTSGQSTGLVEDVSVDVVPGLSINDVAVAEGNVAGINPSVIGPAATSDSPTMATFTVTMSEPSPNTVTVHVSTADGTASTTDTPPDYDPVDTTLTFAPGQTSRSVVVPVDKDDSVEPDETYSVNLSAPTDAVIIDGQGIGTILNDDASPVPAPQ